MKDVLRGMLPEAVKTAAVAKKELDQVAARLAKCQADMTEAQARYDEARRQLEGIEYALGDVKVDAPKVEAPKTGLTDLPRVIEVVTEDPPKKTRKTPDSGKMSKAKEGRLAVAAGERPTMALSVALVMKNDVLNSAQVVERLKARGWMPNASNPQSYAGHSMSTTPELFQRATEAGRGCYRLTAEGHRRAAEAAKTFPEPAAPSPSEPQQEGSDESGRQVAAEALASFMPNA